MTTNVENELARVLHEVWKSAPDGSDVFALMAQAALAPAQPVAMTDERVSIISRLKAQSVAHRHEAETDSADLIDEGIAALSAMTDLLEEARDTIAKLLIKIRRDAPDSAGRLLGYADQVVARVDAALDSPLSAQAVPKVLDEQRCEYCDGTGDVHSIDGQWRGECTVCKPEAQAQAVPEVQKQTEIDCAELKRRLDRVRSEGALSFEALLDLDYVRSVLAYREKLYTAPSPEAKAQAVLEGFAEQHARVQEINRTFGPLIRAAINLIAECQDNLENKPWPQCYGVPYGAVNALRDALTVTPQHPAPSDERKPLTEEDAAALWPNVRFDLSEGREDVIAFARAIEAAHRIRSTGGEHHG